jgi:hypothetical protein
MHLASKVIAQNVLADCQRVVNVLLQNKKLVVGIMSVYHVLTHHGRQVPPKHLTGSRNG